MRNKEITVLHSAKTGEWVDMKREEKVQMQLEKATWLKMIYGMTREESED